MKLLVASAQTWLCGLNYYWIILNFLSVAVTISTTPSPSEDNDDTTLDVENDKDSLRKDVEDQSLWYIYIYMWLDLQKPTET